jgi:hypothetical protein
VLRGPVLGPLNGSERITFVGRSRLRLKARPRSFSIVAIQNVKTRKYRGKYSPHKKNGGQAFGWLVQFRVRHQRKPHILSNLHFSQLQLVAVWAEKFRLVFCVHGVLRTIPFRIGIIGKDQVRRRAQQETADRM